MQEESMVKELNNEITNLDDLLALVAQCPEAEPARVAQEHLRYACQHLAVARYPEYVQDLGNMASLSLRKTADHLIAELIEVAETT
jgi:hypothetical protein